MIIDDGYSFTSTGSAPFSHGSGYGSDRGIFDNNHHHPSNETNAQQTSSLDSNRFVTSSSDIDLVGKVPGVGVPSSHSSDSSHRSESIDGSPMVQSGGRLLAALVPPTGMSRTECNFALNATEGDQGQAKDGRSEQMRDFSTAGNDPEGSLPGRVLGSSNDTRDMGGMSGHDTSRYAPLPPSSTLLL